jgi:hypothetical protein
MASTVPDGRAGVAPVGGAGLAPALWWWLYGVGWLVLLLMLGAILLLLIAPCALRVPGLPAHCPAAGQAVAAEARYTDVLRDRVATLERQIGLADRACQPTPEVPAYLPRRAEAVPRIEGALDRAAIGARLDRSGAQIGDLTFSLIWDGPDDLDLQIVCPTGDRLFWGARSVCRGTLDIDANVRTLEPEPVENAFFNDPPTGAYEVRVILHTSRRDGAPQPFQLVVREDGRMTVHDGVVSGRASQWSHTHRQGQN